MKPPDDNDLRKARKLAPNLLADTEPVGATGAHSRMSPKPDAVIPDGTDIDTGALYRRAKNDEPNPQRNNDGAGPVEAPPRQQVQRAQCPRCSSENVQRADEFVVCNECGGATRIPSARRSSKPAVPKLPKPRRPGWEGELQTTGKTDPVPMGSAFNVGHVLRNAPELDGVLAYDEHRARAVLLKPPPWEMPDSTAYPHDLQDADYTRCVAWMSSAYALHAPIDVVGRGIAEHVDHHHFDLLRDYLCGLNWDGIARVEKWLMTYFGAVDTPHVRACGQAWLISAVARALKPGCKADHVLVLESNQGIQKSSALRDLCGERWFKDDLPRDLGSKDAAQGLDGKWIVEVPEFDGYSKQSAAILKRFFSAQKDHYRPPYGRLHAERGRRCVFAATVNGDRYLHDPTGARRFWPVRCGTVDLASLRRDRDQLWAEAVVLFKGGVPWWLDEATEDLAKLEQDDRYAEDPWEETLRHSSLPDEVTTAEVLTILGVEVKSRGKRDQMRVAEILKRMGWIRTRLMRDGVRESVYVRPSVARPP